MTRSKYLRLQMILLGVLTLILGVQIVIAGETEHNNKKYHKYKNSKQIAVQLGPRPFFLVDDMEEGPLKDELKTCKKKRFKRSDFSIGHRGAPLQYPEHTRESYMAAARMGAG
ncbi:MAG: glycerophosphodiester phosphodiesterase, partial [Thioalkalispiraceae bacterium]